MVFWPSVFFSSIKDLKSYSVLVEAPCILLTEKRGISVSSVSLSFWTTSEILRLIKFCCPAFFFAVEAFFFLSSVDEEESLSCVPIKWKLRDTTHILPYVLSHAYQNPLSNKRFSQGEKGQFKRQLFFQCSIHT